MVYWHIGCKMFSALAILVFIVFAAAAEKVVIKVDVVIKNYSSHVHFKYAQFKYFAL